MTEQFRSPDRTNGKWRNGFLALLAVAILLGTSFTILQFRDDAGSDVNMTLFSDRVQEVDHEETVEYDINVRNLGEDTTVVKLEVFGVPEHWEADLNRDSLRLDPDSRTTVRLSVTAPSRELEMDPSLDRVAAIGVRANGNNDTIGTITILTGSAEIIRDGETIDLVDDYDILSGDIITSSGTAVVTIDLKKLVLDEEQYKGEIYVLLTNAKVSFLSKGQKAYLTVVSGSVTVYVAGGGGGGRAEPIQPHIALTGMEVIDEEFPDLEYNLVMEFDVDVEPAFFHLDVGLEESRVEVYGGEITLGNETADNTTLSRYQAVTLDNLVRTIPNPVFVEKTLIAVRSEEGSVSSSLSSGGENILNKTGVFYLPTAEGDFFITPPGLPEITLDITGEGDGEYEVDFTTIDGFAAQSFQVRSRSSVRRTDSFVYREDVLTIARMDEEKTYDLTIAYDNSKTGESREMPLLGIISSSDEQEIKVDNWELIEEAEGGAVTFKEGDSEVAVKPGTSGEDLNQELESQREEDDEEMDWGLALVASALLILVIVAFLFMGKRGSDGPEQEEEFSSKEDLEPAKTQDEQGLDSGFRDDDSGPIMPWLQADPPGDDAQLPGSEDRAADEPFAPVPVNLPAESKEEDQEPQPPVTEDEETTEAESEAEIDGEGLKMPWDEEPTATDISTEDRPANEEFSLASDAGDEPAEEEPAQDAEEESQPGASSVPVKGAEMPWDEEALSEVGVSTETAEEEFSKPSTPVVEPEEEYIPEAEPAPEESVAEESTLEEETTDPIPRITLEDIEKDFVDLGTINALRNEIADIPTNFGQSDIDDEEWWENWNSKMDRVTKGLKAQEK